MTFTLYPKDLIKKTIREIAIGLEPSSIDQVIHHVDVDRAKARLPEQQRAAIDAWLSSLTADNHADWNLVVEWLGVSEPEARSTVANAWRNLGYELNKDSEK